MLQHGSAGIQTRQSFRLTKPKAAALPSVLSRLVKCNLIMDPGRGLEDWTSKFVAICGLPSKLSQLATLYVPQWMACLLKHKTQSQEIEKHSDTDKKNENTNKFN